MRHGGAGLHRRIPERRLEKKHCYRDFCLSDEDVSYELYDPCGVPGDAVVKPLWMEGKRCHGQGIRL